MENFAEKLNEIVDEAEPELTSEEEAAAEDIQNELKDLDDVLWDAFKTASNAVTVVVINGGDLGPVVSKNLLRLSKESLMEVLMKIETIIRKIDDFMKEDTAA